MTDSPVVDVLILTFNSEDEIVACLDAVRQQDYPYIRTYVLDNGSSDGTLAYLGSDHHHDLFVNENNVGYAVGMNQLLKKASGKYVLFLNADCIIAKSFVRIGVERLEGEPAYGALGGCVWRDLRRNQLDGGPLRITSTMRVRKISGAERPQIIGKPNGSCQFIRREALNSLVEGMELEGFDPVFDTYGEDIDLALRLRSRGWLILYDPSAEAFHSRSASSGAHRIYQKSGRLRINVIAARYLNAVGHLGRVRLVVVFGFLACQDIVFIATRVVVGDFSVVGDIGSAWKRVFREARAKRQRTTRSRWTR